MAEVGESPVSRDTKPMIFLNGVERIGAEIQRGWPRSAWHHHVRRHPSTDSDSGRICARCGPACPGTRVDTAGAPRRGLVVRHPAAHTVAAPPPAQTAAPGTVPVGGFPVAVAVSPDGSCVYVVNSADGSVSVLDTDTGTVTATVAVGREPFGIALTVDGRLAYVANSGDDSVSVIDLSRRVVLATVGVGKAPTEWPSARTNTST